MQVLNSFPNPASTTAPFQRDVTVPSSLVLPPGVFLTAPPKKAQAPPPSQQLRNASSAASIARSTTSTQQQQQQPKLAVQTQQQQQQQQPLSGGNPLNLLQQMLKRAIEGSIPGGDRPKLMRGLCELSPAEIKDIQSVSHDQILANIGAGAQLTLVETDKTVVDFRKALPISMNTPVLDSFFITSKSPRADFRIAPEPMEEGYSLEFTPSSGTIMGGQRVEIQVNLIIKAPVIIKTVVAVEITRGLRHFIVIRPMSAREAMMSASNAIGNANQQQNVTPSSPGGPGNPGGRTPRQANAQPVGGAPAGRGVSPGAPGLGGGVGGASGAGGAVRAPRQLPQQFQNTPASPTQQPQGMRPSPLQGQGQQPQSNQPLRGPGVPGGPQQQQQQQQQGPNPLQMIFIDKTSDTIFPQAPHAHIPKPLALLRALLLSTREGLSISGIFREKGSEAEVKTIREKISKPATQNSIRTRDALAVASCIKMFFRDLPVLLCNEIPAQMILEVKDPQRAWGAVLRMNPLNRELSFLLEWVLDLILATAAQETANGMGIRALCTVWAPNLYGPPAQAEQNQQELVRFMSVSIQMVTFLGLLVAKRKMDLGV
ncbi:UNVERIFIED_CONTAM: hypothetical protein HDU68_009888 [Siphonaria sp. JEL0065]|nr:hypothetical protein HDU68_009888 [Siphonaria sp. JEL0065]